MDCPSCGHPNREGARFCAQCAAPLSEAITCASCGTTNPPGTRYCDSCGHAVADAGAPVATSEGRPQPPEHLADTIRAGRGALEGERKQVTVLFADVMGSMELAEQTDPEAWRL
jgi:hypothetical protein